MNCPCKAKLATGFLLTIIEFLASILFIDLFIIISHFKSLPVRNFRMVMCFLLSTFRISAMDCGISRCSANYHLERLEGSVSD